jgi:hypothetical protein
MRIALALVLAVVCGCSPVLATYVAPAGATDLRSSHPDDAKVAELVRVKDAFGPTPAMVLAANDTPFLKRTITFKCPDGVDVSRDLVSDNLDSTRALLGTTTFIGAGAASVVLVVNAIRADADNLFGYLPGAYMAGLSLNGGLALLFGWHPAPSALVDGVACAGHEAPAIPEASSTSHDG